MANVTITPRRDNPRKCDIDPDPFDVTKGGTVTFVFKGSSKAKITFSDGSPFKDEVKLDSPNKVNDDVVKPNAKFRYTVTWDGGGSGGGTGEVPPGR